MKHTLELKKEFVKYEVAVELKKLGFDEPCFTYYYDISGELRKNISVDIHNGWTYFPNLKLITLAPTFSQAFRFFRERHGLYSLYTMGDYENNFYWQIWRNDYKTKTYITASNYVFEKYEEAEQACLLKLIEIVKNK